MPSRNGSHDPLVVSTAELSENIKLWAEAFDFADDAMEMFRADKKTLASYLSQETGYTNKRILDILNCGTKVTTLETADKIITAMERPDLMPEIIPNPRWNQERWFAHMRERGCLYE